MQCTDVSTELFDLTSVSGDRLYSVSCEQFLSIVVGESTPFNMLVGQLSAVIGGTYMHSIRSWNSFISFPNTVNHVSAMLVQHTGNSFDLGDYLNGEKSIQRDRGSQSARSMLQRLVSFYTRERLIYYSTSLGW